jgi:hypothetical protein
MKNEGGRSQIRPWRNEDRRREADGSLGNVAPSY